MAEQSIGHRLSVAIVELENLDRRLHGNMSAVERVSEASNLERIAEDLYRMSGQIKRGEK